MTKLGSNWETAGEARTPESALRARETVDPPTCAPLTKAYHKMTDAEIVDECERSVLTLAREAGRRLRLERIHSRELGRQLKRAKA